MLTLCISQTQANVFVCELMLPPFPNTNEIALGRLLYNLFFLLATALKHLNRPASIKLPHD